MLLLSTDQAEKLLLADVAVLVRIQHGHHITHLEVLDILNKFKTMLLTFPLPIPCIISNLTVSCRLRVSSQDEREDLVDCQTQLTLIFILLYLYFSVFHEKYQSYKYEKIQLRREGGPEDPSILDSVLLVESQEDFLPVRPQPIWIAPIKITPIWIAPIWIAPIWISSIWIAHI